jgi:DNA-binding HxlR family transcriptional regulator
MESKDTITTDTGCCNMKTIDGYCPLPLEAVSGFLSKKWCISIVITIGNFKTLRFNILHDKLNGVTAKTLSARLKELEKERIVIRKSFNQIPPKVEYSLSKNGKRLMHSLHPLIHWAEKRNQ